MITLDLRKDLKAYYAPSAKKVELIEVPAFQFVMLDGAIEPGMEPGTSPAFQEAFQALYGISFTLKFESKKRKIDPIDYPVMAMEGLWWVKGGEFDPARKDDWSYTLMMLQPDHITPEMFQKAQEQLYKKHPTPSVSKLRLERFCEGLSMQIMHVGPYAAEPATIEKMKAFAQEKGLRRRGHHHEIYLGDPRKAAPDKLKTVLRQPVEILAP